MLAYAEMIDMLHFIIYSHSFSLQIVVVVSHLIFLMSWTYFPLCSMVGVAVCVCVCVGVFYASQIVSSHKAATWKPSMSEMDV